MEVCLIITDTLFKKIYMYLFFKGREERWKDREKERRQGSGGRGPLRVILCPTDSLSGA